jgi:DNA topoisomerase-1
MEESLDGISRGEKEYEQVLTDFWYPFKKQVEEKSLQITAQKDTYRSSQTDVLCPTCDSAMILKIGRFGEYFQCQASSEHQFPKNFREYNVALEAAKATYQNQTDGKVCAVCRKNLIVRVSKASLKPYIACADYQVGNSHTVKPISLGECPRCTLVGRAGDAAGSLVMKKGFRGKSFIGCSLPSEVCGFIEGQDPADAPKPKKSFSKSTTSPSLGKSKFAKAKTAAKSGKTTASRSTSATKTKTTKPRTKKA